MKRFLWIFFLTAFVLTGCSAKTDTFQEGRVPESRKLMVYTAYAEEVYKPLIEEFEERTGLWVEVRPGGAVTLLEELKEHQDGDVFLGGPLYLLEENASLFQLTEAHSVTTMVLIYNPKLVKNSPPEGWTDLMLPVWTGEIAFADPANSGSAYITLKELSEILSLKEDALRQQLSENMKGDFLPFSRDVVPEVANGNYYIGVTLEETALRSVEQGYDISLVYPEDEILLIEGIGIAKSSTKKENAQLFVEFMQGEDAKRYLEEHLHRYSCQEAEVAE